MAIREMVSIDEVIDLLNEAIKADADAMGDLIQQRIICNERLAAHGTIQCQEMEGMYRVGFLGVLNGLFGIDAQGHGAIGAIFRRGEDGAIGPIVCFTRTTAKL